MGIEEFGQNERAIDQQDVDIKEGLHFDTLYDQNEDESGERRNLATGEDIINDSDAHLEKSEIMSVDSKGKLKDLKKELEKEAATKWLLEHNFDEEGNEIKKAA